MDTYELLQWLGLGAGICVAVALVVVVVRFSRAVDAIWPNCTAKYGLVFDERKSGNPLTAQRRVKTLVGDVQGVALRVVSTWELVGRTRRTSTSFIGQALHPAPHRFTVHITRGKAPGSQYHVVPTGDPTFDRMYSLKSDAPHLVRALVGPKVQAAIRQLPMSAVQLSYDEGELCLSYGEQPLRQADLDAPIGVVVAMGLTRLA